MSANKKAREGKIHARESSKKPATKPVSIRKGKNKDVGT